MGTLPKKIYLTATKKHWHISYIHTAGKLELLELPYNKIIIYGKNYSKLSAIKLLNKWVRKKSRDYLTIQVNKLNQKVKVHYSKLRIHSLKTEWGSYTSTKILNLNYKIIFLPPALVKYIIIHELCHFRHLNHSTTFWKDVEKYDKNWRKHKKAISGADQHIPNWIIL